VTPTHEKKHPEVGVWGPRKKVRVKRGKTKKNRKRKETKIKGGGMRRARESIATRILPGATKKKETKSGEF